VASCDAVAQGKPAADGGRKQGEQFAFIDFIWFCGRFRPVFVDFVQYIGNIDRFIMIFFDFLKNPQIMKFKFEQIFNRYSQFSQKSLKPLVRRFWVRIDISILGVAQAQPCPGKRGKGLPESFFPSLKSGLWSLASFDLLRPQGAGDTTCGTCRCHIMTRRLHLS
jgi:hypothetical protein